MKLGHLFSFPAFHVLEAESRKKLSSIFIHRKRLDGKTGRTISAARLPLKLLRNELKAEATDTAANEKQHQALLSQALVVLRNSELLGTPNS